MFIMGRLDDYIEDERTNEVGETEYKYEDEWYTKDELDEMESEMEYWEEQAKDWERQDEDPDY